MSEPESYRYEAFISYRHVEPDRRWAKWLHKALETFRTPRPLVRNGVPPRIERVFRDEEELPASADLSREIDDALTGSRFLIVVCSPRTPGSAWVNQEVVRFRELGRGDRILALLIEGGPGEAFPASLREIRTEVINAAGARVVEIEDVEPLAADVRASRDEPRRTLKRMARLRLSAALLGCRFDDLRRREAERQRRKTTALVAGLLLLTGTLAGLTWTALRARDRERAAKERALADAARLADLNAIRAALWQPDPQGPPSTADLRAAERRIAAGLEALVRLPGHEREMGRLESGATSRPEGEAGVWTFPDSTDAATHALLVDLVHDGQALAHRFRRSFETADTSLWNDTVRAIGDVEENPIYQGGTLPGPQFGLVPLGKNARSGLFEFAHVYSGSRPEPGPDGAWAEDAAIVFVLVPPGTFWMGAQDDDPQGIQFDPRAQDEEGPVHEVTVPWFFLAKHETTQAQWKRLADERPSRFAAKDVGRSTARHPVEQVSWFDCRRVAARYALRLPTEAEWEYACRAGTGTPWWYGSDPDALDGVAWYTENAEERTHPVGRLAANGFGLLDVHGNVFEWCEDEAHDSYAGAPTDGTAMSVPGQGFRIVRGGGWVSRAAKARAAARFLMGDPGGRFPSVGVRLARPVTAK